MIINELELEQIKVGEVKYPLAYNLNVQARLQKEYGSLRKWLEKIAPQKKDKEDEEQEVDIEAVIITARELINEGINIENDNLIEKRPYISKEEAGRIVSRVGIAVLRDKLFEMSASGKEENEEKNG